MTGTSISCGATIGGVAHTDCDADVAYDAVFTLSATAATGYSLSDWGGACDSSSAPGACTLNWSTANNSDQTIAASATFSANQYTLTFTAGANGYVTMVGDITDPSTDPVTRDGLSCGSGGRTDCTATVTFDQPYTIYTFPDTGYVVDTWQDLCEGSGSASTCSLTVTSTTPTAGVTFKAGTYTVTIGTHAHGTITSGESPKKIDCTSSESLASEGCAADYVYPATVVLTATPDTGYSFGSWGNCPSAVSNVCTIASISASRTVTATFTANQYTVTVTRPTAGGYVTMTGDITDANTVPVTRDSID